MRSFIVIFTLFLSFSTYGKSYKGKLRCWDNANPSRLIPTYIDKYFNSPDYTDENHRNSFIMDFSTPLYRWEFERVGFKVKYGWSISECEDFSEFIFRRIDLERVLRGQLKTTNVKYFYYHPDEYTIIRVLKCERAEDRVSTESPTFNLF